MRYLAMLIACVACALPARATVDPDVDQIGVYFDLSADEVCLEVAPYSIFSAYLIITNPSATEVQGIEFGICVDGAVTNAGYVWYENWIGQSFFQEGFHCMGLGFEEPVPLVGSNVPLARIDHFLLSDSVVEFYLNKYTYFADNSSQYWDASGNAYPLGISSGDPDLPVAVVNGDCDVVSVTGKTFGDVKSLFR